MSNKIFKACTGTEGGWVVWEFGQNGELCCLAGFQSTSRGHGPQGGQKEYPVCGYQIFVLNRGGGGGGGGGNIKHPQETKMG